MGAFTAFLVALFTEMYGVPLTVYLLSSWLGSRFPALQATHSGGHLWNDLAGWDGDPHLSPFHLTGYLAIGPEQLSGGEKQRVAVARALANDPAVLLADEPTANLDAAHGREVARLLQRLATEDGRAVVIVSHDARLRDIADRVLWLEDGAFRELSAMATDPVCSMAVEQHDKPHLQHAGRTWWFCSTACRDEYRVDPERFTNPVAGAAGGPL
jgi:YHS domain-containing protein